MEIRHLRCFIAVAEELHFARAAERLHIEQSPLSRAIKELEEDLGAQLFVRNTRSTRLTRAGQLFLEHVPQFRWPSRSKGCTTIFTTWGLLGQMRLATASSPKLLERSFDGGGALSAPSVDVQAHPT